ncbi:DUF2141 domain-containing protein [Stieleria sp. TO1_6]|uniref:DUF2141 domain-containing protein n=1 Tax=Stieleria tagensis TaxID=2956795 RepID=UPI00209B4B8E|nr:DUF2141 domain-containing protein [Stieleria tagensis]MCO8121017.1 DUF2141 domain-containing protein [Stieleria tagensis]
MPPLNETSTRRQPNRQGRFKRAWKDSHGTWLLGFAGVIFLIGLLMIRLSPPGSEEPTIDFSEDVSAPIAPALPPDAMIIRVTTSQPASHGPIRIALYDSKESFGDTDKAVIKDSLVPVDGFVIWEIKRDFLPEQFAIAAYHDLDDNGELNRALFNAPVEPYGFSNNARSVIGAPTYEQTIIERPTEPTILEIRVY